MTREELDTHLLYNINSNLVALQLMMADYLTHDGKVNESFVKETINDSYNTLEKLFKQMDALDKGCKYCRGKK